MTRHSLPKSVGAIALLQAYSRSKEKNGKILGDLERERRKKSNKRTKKKRLNHCTLFLFPLFCLSSSPFSFHPFSSLYNFGGAQDLWGEWSLNFYLCSMVYNWPCLVIIPGSVREDESESSRHSRFLTPVWSLWTRHWKFDKHPMSPFRVL